MNTEEKSLVSQGSTKYNNFVSFLESIKWRMITSYEDFNKNDSFETECVVGHKSSFTKTSFINKKCKYYKTQEFLCKHCSSGAKLENKLDKVRNEIRNLCGHEIISLERDKKVKYICGNCKSECQSYLQNLRKNKSFCSNCQNDQTKNEKDNVRERVKKFGMELISYKNNKEVIVKCVCGNPNYKTTLHDIESGKQCAKYCKYQKYKATINKNSGVDNCFQIQQVKDKIKQTHLEKRGAEHHMKTEECKKKAQDTCVKLYGTKFAFNQPWVFELIRQTHMKNHGVPFPLMAKAIREKCEQTCMENWGAIQPFLSEKFIQKNKKLMLEKYGVEYFFSSEVFKEVMLDRYGVEHAMHCPQLFHKAMKSMFSTKEYTFPNSKRVVQLMGYEPRCIDYLLNNENTVLKRIIKEEEIGVEEEVPVFDYKDETGKKRKYYPDMCVKGTKLIIEVKSTYTFNLDYKNNYLKFRAVEDAGYVIQVYIYDNKSLQDIWTFESGQEVKSNKWKTFDTALEI